MGQIVEGFILAPSLPTCGDKTFDFAVASKRLPISDLAIRRLDDTSFNPHWAVRVFISSDIRRKAVRRLVRPKRIDALQYYGPLAAEEAIPADANFGGLAWCI